MLSRVRVERRSALASDIFLHICIDVGGIDYRCISPEAYPVIAPTKHTRASALLLSSALGLAGLVALLALTPTSTAERV